MMKKALLIIFTVVALVVFFTACSVTENELETVSTTAITDENGTTHYYEIVTDEENQTVLNEIKTDKNGNPVTDKNGSYETVANQKSSVKITYSDDKSTGTSNPADNEVPFESTTNDDSKEDTRLTEKEKLTTADHTTAEDIQPATDADGWINKWY